MQTGPGTQLHSAAVGTGAFLEDEVAMCGVDCQVPRPGASDGVLWGELYLYVTELIRCVHKIAKVIISFILSSCRHGATGFPLNGFL
jgi:hypothetical protein